MTRASDWQAVARDAFGARAGDDVVAQPPIELLAIELDGASYALPVERVREIVRPRCLTPVPRTPDWVLGVVALRGEVVQVVDLRQRLGLAPATVGRASRIVVVFGEDDGIAGVLVDAVRQVLRVDASALRPSASADARAVSEICANGDAFVSVVDLDRVLGDAD